MRQVLANNALPICLVLSVLLLVSMLLPLRPQQLLYTLVRQAMVVKINFETREMAVAETPHFIIKYTPMDEPVVDMVAQAAEAAYTPVTQALGYVPKQKTLVLIYPDKSQLRQAFGWSGDQNAMGVYWGGVIQILSPRLWLQSGNDVAEFIHAGPMVHEFTHLVLDHVTGGNYSRWFTEGLAQFAEYQINGYEWITPANRLTGEIYTMAELDRDFDNLPNQALAYRESLAAVRYIAEVYGQDKLQQVISLLSSGNTMPAAIKQATGVDYQTFGRAWQEWAKDNLKNYND